VRHLPRWMKTYVSMSNLVACQPFLLMAKLGSFAARSRDLDGNGVD
jgi:hypothetical protein